MWWIRIVFPLHFSFRIPFWGIDLGSVVGLSGIREILFTVPVMMDQFTGLILAK